MKNKKIKKIKIKKDSNISINGYIENRYGTKLPLSATEKIIIEKLNEIIDEIYNEEK